MRGGAVKTIVCDVAVVGGGPAGLAAAVSARKNGAAQVVILERDRELGGILQQCIHNGFGLHRYQQELTGPGYAGRAIGEALGDDGILVMLDTMVLEMSAAKLIRAVSPENGVMIIKAKAVVLAMGCRERPRGAIRIPGARPAGVYTAGAAQRMVNIEGYLPGREIVILGSGDIGLIMARRMVLEGAKVKAAVEIMPYSGGLTRNIVQCLEDYDIPLYLSHTVTRVEGKERVGGVWCAKVDGNRRPLPQTEFFISCDCLLLSVGLIPENELSQSAGIVLDRETGGPVVNQRRETSLDGFFAAGNAVQVHDLVDLVSEEGDIAGKNAALYAKKQVRAIKLKTQRRIALKAGDGVRAVVPQVIEGVDEQPVKLFIRASLMLRKARLQLLSRGKVLLEKQLAVVKPSEMEVVSISAGKLAEAGEEVLLVLRPDGGESSD